MVGVVGNSHLGNNFRLEAFLATVLIVAIPATCEASQEFLLWSEEFDYDGAPDPDIWSYDTGTGFEGWGNKVNLKNKYEPRVDALTFEAAVASFSYFLLSLFFN